MITDKKISIPIRMMEGKAKIMCVYKLLFGDKFYIGSSCDLRHRIRQHIRNIKNNKSKYVVALTLKCFLKQTIMSY